MPTEGPSPCFPTCLSMMDTRSRRDARPYKAATAPSGGVVVGLGLYYTPQVGDDSLPLWLWDRVRFVVISHRGDDAIEAAEVLLPHDLGLTVYPLALASVVVSPSADDLLGDACHE